MVDKAVDVGGGGTLVAVNDVHGFPHAGELVVGGGGEVAAYTVRQSGIGGCNGIVVEAVQVA